MTECDRLQRELGENGKVFFFFLAFRPHGPKTGLSENASQRGKI